jgi:hypothetical protein
MYSSQLHLKCLENLLETGPVANHKKICVYMFQPQVSVLVNSPYCLNNPCAGRGNINKFSNH